MQHEEAACVCGMNVSLLGQSLSPASQSAMTREGKLATSVPANHGRHGGHAQGVGWKGQVARQGHNVKDHVNYM